MRNESKKERETISRSFWCLYLIGKKGGIYKMEQVVTLIEKRKFNAKC